MTTTTIDQSTTRDQIDTAALIARAHAAGLETLPSADGLMLWWPHEDPTQLLPLTWEDVPSWLDEYAGDVPVRERVRPAAPTQELVEQAADDDAPLTSAEQRALATHEATIQAGIETFFAVGLALLTISHDRLYRATHQRFEDYIADRWPQFRGVRHVYRMIAAAEVIESVTNWSETTGIALPPVANEAQARVLAQLPAEDRGPVYAEAVATAPNGKVTATHIEKTARRNEPPVPTFPDLPPELTGWRWSTNAANGAFFLMHPDQPWTFTTKQYHDPTRAIDEAVEWVARRSTPKPDPAFTDLQQRAETFGFTLHQQSNGYELFRDGKRYSLTADLAPVADTIRIFEEGAAKRAAPIAQETTQTVTSAELYDLLQKAFSADRIAMRRPIVQPAEWDGKLWVGTGGMSSPRERINQREGQRVIPSTEWNGPRYTYEDRPLGQYMGLQVRYGNVDYVITGEKLIAQMPQPTTTVVEAALVESPTIAPSQTPFEAFDAIIDVWQRQRSAAAGLVWLCCLSNEQQDHNDRLSEILWQWANSRDRERIALVLAEAETQIALPPLTKVDRAAFEEEVRDALEFGVLDMYPLIAGMLKAVARYAAVQEAS